MPGTHDPDHARGASLVLPDATEETGHPTPTRKERMVHKSRPLARFWLGLVAFLVGLALLATGLIFFSAWPGALGAEAIGAGLALLAVGLLLLTGAWRLTRPHQTDNAALPDAALDLPNAPAPPTTPTQPAIPPPAPEPVPASSLEGIAGSREGGAPEASAAPSPTPAGETPAVDTAPSPGRLEAGGTEDSITPGRLETDAPEAEPPALATGKTAPRARAPGKQSSHTTTPRSRPKAPTNGTEPRLPALTNLPRGIPLPAEGVLIDAEAEDLGDLLGDIAEQSALAVLTRGKRGVERRARLATKIETFRQEMARDPDYAPIAAYLEAIVGLLHAGKPVPSPKPLVDPFDGLYEYGLKLIRRKSGLQHD